MLLPDPSPDALSASRALESLIRQEISSNQNWISFARFMELALYAQNLGYYAAGAAKLGKDGDFTTAPEITTLFGATLASFAASLNLPSPLRVMEFGAGSGKLAEDFLQSARELDLEVADYLIVELSSDLRDRQQQRLPHRQSVRRRLPGAGVAGRSEQRSPPGAHQRILHPDHRPAQQQRLAADQGRRHRIVVRV